MGRPPSNGFMESPWAKISEQARQDIIKSYLDGNSTRLTAYLCVVSPKTVRRVLEKAGIPCRQRGEWKKIDRGEVARLRKKGYSQQAIADCLMCSPSGVRRVLDELLPKNGR